MNNRFDYTNDFSKIVELSFYHEYFASNNLENIDLIPDRATTDLIRNYSLILRKKENTFVVFRNNNSNVGSLVFSGTVTLKFVLMFKDQLFLNYTDIPFQYHQKFVLNALEGDKSRLHPQTYADESIVEPYIENGIIGEISLEINQNNETIVRRIQLTRSYQQFTIPLVLGVNKIAFLARNEGLYSPNTAGFMIFDQNGKTLMQNDWFLATGAKAFFTIVRIAKKQP